MNDSKLASSYGAFDRFKLLAAILVIAIHTGPLLSYSPYSNFILTSIVARIAVPFFFAAAGFFLFRKLVNKPINYWKIVHQYTKKIAMMYGAVIVLYLPVSWYRGYFSTDLSFIRILQDIIFNGTIYHLWYFPALIAGTYIIAVLYYYFSLKISLVIASLLYVVGLLGDSYYGAVQLVPSLHAAFEWMFQWFDYTRNGLLFAPIFIGLGVYFASTKRKAITMDVYAGWLLISFIVLALEAVILQYVAYPKHDSMYILLVPVLFCLIGLLLQVKLPAKVLERKMSVIVYIIHPLVIIGVRGLAKKVGWTDWLVTNSVVHFVTVTILSLGLAYLISFYMLRTKQQEVEVRPAHAWAEIDLHRLQYNATQLQQLLPHNCSLMAVIKANAYGHGAIETADALEKIGIDYFAVATINEAIELRQAGMKGQILVLSRTFPDRFSDLHHYQLIQSVVDVEYALQLNAYKKVLQVHLKIDTGMGRVGTSAAYIDDIVQMLQLQQLDITGMFSHLATADHMQVEGQKFAKLQIDRFYQVANELKARGLNPGKLHIQSSYGILNHPQQNCDIARAGISLFGIGQTDDVKLQPVLSLKAMVTTVKTVAASTPLGYDCSFITKRTSRIATVAIGYADGIVRQWYEVGGYVLIKGKKAPLSGKISMDQLLIDVTDIEDVKAGDIVTLIGQDGEEEITAAYIAEQLQTVPNEIFCHIGARVERVYHYR